MTFEIRPLINATTQGNKYCYEEPIRTSKKDMKRQKMDFIIMTIEHLVNKSDRPAVGKILQDNGVATRQELRKLESEGRLQSCYVGRGQGALRAYYTEGAMPSAIRNVKAGHNQPSEVDNPEPSQVSS